MPALTVPGPALPPGAVLRLSPFPSAEPPTNILTPGARAGRRNAIPGWVGVALLAVVTGLFAMFAFGEWVSDRFPGFLAHLVQAALMLGYGALAIARSGVGAAVLAIPGLLVLVRLFILIAGGFWCASAC